RDRTSPRRGRRGLAGGRRPRSAGAASARTGPARGPGGPASIQDGGYCPGRPNEGRDPRRPRGASTQGTHVPPLGPEEGREEDEGTQPPLRGPAGDWEDNGRGGDLERTRTAHARGQLCAAREHVGR